MERERKILRGLQEIDDGLQKALWSVSEKCKYGDFTRIDFRTTKVSSFLHNFALASSRPVRFFRRFLTFLPILLYFFFIACLDIHSQRMMHSRFFSLEKKTILSLFCFR